MKAVLTISVSLVIFFIDIIHCISYTPITFKKFGIDNEINVNNDDSYNYNEHYFNQPVDHFNESDYRTFNQRYYVNDKHFKPNGPIYVLESGETSAVNRLSVLDTGITEILSKNTSGMGIALEHRYYGKSLPFDIFDTDNLTYLSYDQSLEDTANFIENFKFQYPQTNGSKFVVYGGSYAGARAAHLRQRYPHLITGAIASSAVTHSEIDYWRYFDMIRLHQSPTCIDKLSNAIKTIDTILDFPFNYPKKREFHSYNDKDNYIKYNTVLKSLFGLMELDDVDFADLITYPLAFVQSKNWDKNISSTEFDDFCEYISTTNLKTQLIEQFFGKSLNDILNYGNWIQRHVVRQCPSDKSVKECFATNPNEEIDVRPSSMRAWGYQVCTQWGYFQGAPPKYHSEAYNNRIVSNRLTLDVTSAYCHRDYKKGDFNSIPPVPKVDDINSLGDFNLRYSRLAFVDGDSDPWLECTPHSTRAKSREDQVNEPSILIEGGTHHWDENGMQCYNDEPVLMKNVHDKIIEFVNQWLN